MNTLLPSGIRHTLRLEALLVLLAALYGYQLLGLSWLMFAALFLLPDLSLLLYACGPRAGALAYNLTHSYIAPLLLGLLSPLLHDNGWALPLIWIAHIAMDRALGFGLKSTQGFAWTHLGRIGKQDKT